jgi:uncharacterized protein YecE (DUF72 family)
VAATEFRVGTASWTDPTLVKSGTFYPPFQKTAEDRLRFYAEHFNTVEVDSTYYAIPAERNAQLWVARTPDNFIFNIKAFAWLTQHETETSRLPKDLRAMLPERLKSARRAKNPPAEVLDAAFQMFSSALQPLRQSGSGGKMGMVLFQFPPYFIYREENFRYIASLKERLPDTSIAVEFRHASWVADPRRRADTLKFLRENGLYFVSIDAPVAPSIPPSFIEATGDQAYTRFHGRNREAWFKRGITPAERFKYLYAERELSDWAERFKSIRGVSRAYVVFNNCYSNFGIMNATTMREILARQGS